MTTIVRVGIVGLGAIGATHAGALRALSGVEVVAFSGGSDTVMSANGWPNAERMSPDEVLEHPSVDVVAVCSPSASHAPYALRAVNAGKHVLVEKPLALSTAEAEALATEQDARGVVVAMVAQRRFEPEVVAIKALLDSGELGNVRLATTQVHWMRDQAYYDAASWRAEHPAGGSLMNQGVHNLDLLQWLCGPVADVTAQSATLAHEMEAEDTLVATARFASGALGVISTTTAAIPGAPATLTLHTSRGTIELGQGEITRWDVAGVSRPTSSAATTSGAADPAAIGLAGHVAMWEEVLEAIRTGRRCAVDAHAAERTVRLLCALYDAAESGQRTIVEAQQ